MKKSLLLAVVALLGLAPTASAHKLLTRAEVSTEIVDGAYIALSCKDYNGGVNFFFNGTGKKTANLTSAQIWKVVADNGKFALQRVSDDKYVGASGNNVSIVDGLTQAAKFTAAGATVANWTSTYVTPATAPSIRFTNGNGVHLNTQQVKNVPNYGGGTGGWSVWYVYKFTEDEVNEFKAADAEGYTPQPLPQLEGHNIVRRNIPATEIDQNKVGWYLIYSVGTGKYLKQEGKNLVLENFASDNSDFENGGSATDNAGYLFQVDPAEYTDFGNAYVNIQSGLGGYIALNSSNEQSNVTAGNASTVSLFPRSFHIADVPGEDNYNKYFLKDKVTFNYANATTVNGNTTFCGWHKDDTPNNGGDYYGHTPYEPTESNIDPNDVFYFYPVELVKEGETIVTFTVNLTYNGEVFRTREFIGVPGEEFRAYVPAFFADGADNENTMTFTCPETDGAVVEVELSKPVFPFEVSESFANAKWQAVRIQCAGQRNLNYVWWYDPTTTDGRAHRLAENSDQTGFTDNELWAFVGTLEDGFKIYNKAAGESVCLIEGNGKYEFASVDDSNINKALFRPYPSNNTQDYHWTEYWCFRSLDNKAATGTNIKYINLQGQGSGNQTADLKNWTGTDAGSTLWTVAPSELMLKYASAYEFEQRPIHKHDDLDVAPVINQVPEYAVGAYDFPDEWEYLTTGQGIIDAAAEDPYDLEKAEALKALIAAWEENVVEHEFNYNHFYRILNAQHGQYIRTNSTDNNIVGVGLDGINKDYHSIMQFVPCEDGDHYFIKSQGLYFGKVNGNSAVQQVESTDEAAQFEAYDPANHDRSIFVFGDISSTDQSLDQNPKVCLHLANPSSNVSGWGTGAAGSHFLLVQANDVDIELPYTIGEKKVGFGYFPFSVSVASTGASLHYLHEQGGVLMSSVVNVVPAHTPFMIIGTTGEVTLNVVTTTPSRVQAREGENMGANIMAGTLRPATAQVDDYVVAPMTQAPNVGKIGLVKVTSETAVAGNSIYVPAASLSDVAKESDEIPLEDVVTTGISEIISGIKGVSVVYDLQGRRLAAPAKGINIINGTKVLVK